MVNESAYMCRFSSSWPVYVFWLVYLRYMFIGRTDVEAEIPILRPPDAKSWLI